MRIHVFLMLGTVLCLCCAELVVNCPAAEPSTEGSIEKNAEGQDLSENKEKASDAGEIKILHHGIRLTPDEDRSFTVLNEQYVKTRIMLLAYRPEGGIVKSHGGTIEVFKDDLGTDLRRTDEGDHCSGIGDFKYYYSEDTKALVFKLLSLRLPAPGATRLTVAGTVNIELGTLKTDEHKSLPLRKGTTFTVHDKKYNITKVKRQGSVLMFVEIRPPGDGFRVLKFLDAQGDEIKWGINSTFSGPERSTYTLWKVVDSATIQVSYWTEKKETVSVPFELDVTLGPDEPIDGGTDE